MTGLARMYVSSKGIKQNCIIFRKFYNLVSFGNIKIIDLRFNSFLENLKKKILLRLLIYIYIYTHIVFIISAIIK